MPRRRSTAHLTIDQIKLAQLLGQAWSAAKAIERKRPRVFTAALADAMELEDEQAISFMDTMEREYVDIENAKHSIQRKG